MRSHAHKGPKPNMHGENIASVLQARNSPPNSKPKTQITKGIVSRYLKLLVETGPELPCGSLSHETCHERYNCPRGASPFRAKYNIAQPAGKGGMESCSSPSMVWVAVQEFKLSYHNGYI